MLKETFRHQFQRNARQRKLLQNGDRIVVAVSGGIDSIVLLDVLFRLKEEFQLHLVVGHFNHKLRGAESEADETFVKTLAEKYHLPFYTGDGQTAEIAEHEKKSIQETARNLRYTFFRELRHSIGFDKIATAHNANDNAETVLFNLLRGAGVKGLCGIPAIRSDEQVVRPLLFATRDEIKHYVDEHHLEYREDSSNKKTDYSRNFLRHSIIPLLSQSINSNLIETLNRDAELFSLLDSYLRQQLNQLNDSLILVSSSTSVILDRELFTAQPEFMQYYAMYSLAKQFSQNEVKYETVREMLAIADAETGAWCALDDSTRLYKDRNTLVLMKQPPSEEFHIPVSPDHAIKSDDFEFISSFVRETNFSKNRNIEFIDAQRLGSSLSLRNWKNGDWFIPLGMKEKKKVSDFFIEQKIPIFKKRTVPLLTSDDSIVWVCGQRLDERFKVTLTTTSILKLEYRPLYE